MKQKTGPDHVDIITFYNEIFVPAVKPLLVELAPGGSEQGSSHASDAKSNIDGKFLSRVQFFNVISLMTIWSYIKGIKLRQAEQF